MKILVVIWNLYSNFGFGEWGSKKWNLEIERRLNFPIINQIGGVNCDSQIIREEGQLCV